jgi:hypothetical protein
MKKLITSILVLAMIIAMAPAAMAAEEGLSNFTKSQTYTQGQFSDVAEGKWYTDSVKKAYELGLMKGGSGDSFNINGNITIAETLALACRINNIYYGGDGVFEQGSPWYQVYADYAIEKGIIISANYTATATRSDFVAILGNSLPESAFAKINDISLIPDVDITDEDGIFIYMFYEAGILTGSDEYGTFNPKSNIQRSEVAAIVTRIVDETERKEVTLKEAENTVTVNIGTVLSGNENYTYEDAYDLYQNSEKAFEYAMEAWECLIEAEMYYSQGDDTSKSQYLLSMRAAKNKAADAANREQKIIDSIETHGDVYFDDGTTLLTKVQKAYRMLNVVANMSIYVNPSQSFFSVMLNHMDLALDAWEEADNAITGLLNTFETETN